MVERNSVETKFKSVAHGICARMWIKKLLEEIKVCDSNPMKVHCDNKVVISIAHNSMLHDKTKHVEIDKHFIKEKLDNKLICMSYILTSNQIVNMLAKGTA